jgi:hypothetical protein
MRPGERSGWSKRRQDNRQARTGRFRGWVKASNATLAPELLARIRNGFGDAATGEDTFDATAGMISMIDALQLPGRHLAPDIRAVLTVEGWILGELDHLKSSATPTPSARQT